MKEKQTKPKPGRIRKISAKASRDKRRNDPDREQLAKALERGLCS